MNELIETLFDMIYHNDRTKLGYLVACAIIINYNNIPNMDINEVAKTVDISSYTLKYFIRILGFKSYEALQETIAANI